MLIVLGNNSRFRIKYLTVRWNYVELIKSLKVDEKKSEDICNECHNDTMNDYRL